MVYFVNGLPYILNNESDIQFVNGEILPILSDYVPESDDTERVYLFIS